MAAPQPKNVKLDRKDNILIITVDLEQDFGPSKTGKTNIIATTAGAMPVPGEPTIKVGVNVYTKR